MKRRVSDKKKNLDATANVWAVSINVYTPELQSRPFWLCARLLQVLLPFLCHL